MILRSSMPGGHEESARSAIEYFANGRVKSVLDGDGVSYSFSYDDAGRLASVRDSAGNVMLYALTSAGLPERVEYHNGNGDVTYAMESRYNALGQLVSGMDRNGQRMTLAYSDAGRVASISYEAGRVDEFSHDERGRLVRIVEDAGGIMRESSLHYGMGKRVMGVKDPGALLTAYEYDSRGAIVGMQSPDTGALSLLRDAAGNVRRRVDGRGASLDYNYDALSRVISIAGNGSERVTYGYDERPNVCGHEEHDSVGELVSAVADVSSFWCFDAGKRSVREVRQVDGQVMEHAYEYSKAGRLHRIRYPDGNVVEYVRSATGSISAIELVSKSGARTRVVDGIRHLPFGPVSAWDMVDGRHMTIEHDKRYRPVAVYGHEDDGVAIGIGYTESSMIEKISDLKTGALIADMQHDRLGRLTWVSGAGEGRYSYDKTGNRTSIQVGATINRYEYADSSHHLVGVDGDARRYDDSGNLIEISATGTSFTYDSLGRMVQADSAENGSAEYGYDGKGRRAWRRTRDGRVHWVYGQDWRLLGEYDDAGRAIVQVIWLYDRPIALLLGEDAVVFHVETDHLGAPRAVVDPRRNKAVWTWGIAGEAFGHSAPDEDPDQDGVSFRFNMRFPGQYHDDASGLNYNYHRDYDPSTGRYVQSDPIGLGGGLGTYIYADNSPLRKTDRWGLEVDVYVWNRLPYVQGFPSAGKLHSTFGHVSVDANGASYSFGTSGMARSPDYSDEQRGVRGGDMYRLNLGPDEERLLADCLDEDHGRYALFSNNCGHPVQNCLRKIGRPLGPFNSTYPSELKLQLHYSPMTKSHRYLPWLQDRRGIAD